MQALRLETTVNEDGTIHLRGLPWRAGEVVEVLLMTPTPVATGKSDRPLAGLPLRYERPLDPAVEPEAWEANQ
jgi:hypothetical protein